MKEQLEAIRQKALNELENAASIQDIEAVRIKFLGKKGELNGTILYLSSDASSYVQGQFIVVDGGITLV